MWWRKMTSFPKTTFSFYGWIGQLKTCQIKNDSTRRRINAIWWNIKINPQKVVDICGYVLPTNFQNFTQNDLTEVKIFPKVIGGATFLKHPVEMISCTDLFVYYVLCWCWNVSCFWTWQVAVSWSQRYTSEISGRSLNVFFSLWRVGSWNTCNVHITLLST